MDTVTSTSLLWPLGSWMQEYEDDLHPCLTDNRQMNSRMKNNVFWSGDWKYLESGTHLKCVPPLLPDLGEGLPNDWNIEVIPGHVWFVVDCKFLINDSFVMCFSVDNNKLLSLGCCSKYSLFSWLMSSKVGLFLYCLKFFFHLRQALPASSSPIPFWPHETVECFFAMSSISSPRTERGERRIKQGWLDIYLGFFVH